jgi:hypothetical protein
MGSGFINIYPGQTVPRRKIGIEFFHSQARLAGASTFCLVQRADRGRQWSVRERWTSGKTNRFDGVGFGLKCEKPFDSFLEIGSGRGLLWGVRPA